MRRLGRTADWDELMVMQPIAEVRGRDLRPCSLLGVLLAGPDPDTALDGMYRVVLEIRAKPSLLQKACADI